MGAVVAELIFTIGYLSITSILMHNQKVNRENHAREDIFNMFGQLIDASFRPIFST